MDTSPAEKASILVVDDNPLIVNVLTSLFASEDYQVFSCTNGEEALSMLGEKYVDVIVCDVMMPKMDGYQLHEMVRKKADFSHIPFVFLTALGDDFDVIKGKETGADDYVVKPFDPRELLAVVKGKVVRSKNLQNLSEERYETYRKRVIHTLSHEFRTPLVAINTGTELLLDQGDRLNQERFQNLLEAIQRGGHRLERLVNDFMLLQQIEAGISARMYEGHAHECKVFDLAHRVVESRKESMREVHGSIQCVDATGGAVAYIYEPQIEDILGRLIDNAVKFSPNEPEIEVHCCLLDGEIAIEVRDRGIGIDAEKVREAIDVFGQIDRERLEQQGGGLGLAIANRYANIQGGRLDFELRREGGSVVSLILPIRSQKS